MESLREKLLKKLKKSDIASHPEKERGQVLSPGNPENIEIKFSPEKIEKEIPLIESYLINYQKYASDFISPIQEEQILSERSVRYTVFPIEYKDVWKNYKQQLQNNWVVEEIDLSKDAYDWENVLDDNDRLFIMHILAFFASADGIVNANIKENLIDLVKIKEAECAYGKQFEMENIHGELYSLLLETFIKDSTLRKNLINSVSTISSIKKKAEWCRYWIDSDMSYAHKLFAFAVVEGVFFSGSFASIFWLKTRGNIMPGLMKSNKFISRDENLHVVLAWTLYLLLKNKLKYTVVIEILRTAVEIEDEYINVSLPCRLLGMNSELMSQYIRYVADRLLVQFGYPKFYHVENPFEFMKKIDNFVKSNFFDERNDAYSSSTIGNPQIYKVLEDF